uniref:Peptidoglycan glycosyltransferase MrdB n=1 Tax=Magnetococcus massalia (strain MO-1) TaxID=451514 RepID=A0A1S7LET4_MAGMO|nr:Rod shape-determining protein [Candidatus Magnetococcus massalia]
MSRRMRKSVLAPSTHRLSMEERIYRFPWGLMLIILAILGLGMMVLYSAGGAEGGGSLVMRQGVRLSGSLVLLFVLALAGEKVFRHHAYLIYLAALILLLVVFGAGTVGMGAQRWIDLGVIRLQPSELMKVALVMALARWFHDRGGNKQIGVRELIGPIILIAIPMILILKQPDLGTALAVGAAGAAVIFVAGISWKALAGFAVVIGSAMPIAWNNLHDYQRQRVLTLFSPESDPLGSGYHIIQSKIAVGSGGLFGKGFLNGSQNQLDFLPERHTDFIFSVLAEEWGFIGAIIMLGLFALIVVRGFYISMRARNRFGMLMATGLTTMLGLQVVINVGMVVGVLPVVGIPLPLVSYGGSSLLTVMMAIGLLAHVSIHSKPMSRPV